MKGGREVVFDTGEAVAPTHRCFDDALDYIQGAAMKGDFTPDLLDYIEHVIKGTRAPRAASRIGRALARYTVVHGICLRPTDGDPFAHAWVEHEGYAVQATLIDRERVFYRMTMSDFRKAWRPRETTRYTVDEILRKNYASGTYGPWEEKYAALVNPRGSLVKEA